MRHDLLRGLTQRYVAGEELADGIVVAQTLNTQRLLVSLDHLGESVTNGPEARRAVGAYVDALEAIAHDDLHRRRPNAEYAAPTGQSGPPRRERHERPRSAARRGRLRGRAGGDRARRSTSSSPKR